MFAMFSLKYFFFLPTFQKYPLQTICAYCDVSGLFTTQYPQDREKDPKIFRSDADIKK